MITIVANQHNNRYPLIIGANFDFTSTDKTKANVVEKSSIIGIATQPDDLSNKCRLAINKYGLFVNLLWQDIVNDPVNVENFTLLFDLLSSATNIEELLAAVKSIKVQDYKPFNLIFGKVGEVYLSTSYLVDEMNTQLLPKGISVVSTHMFNKCNVGRNTNIHVILNNFSNQSWTDTYKLLKSILRDSKRLGEFDSTAVLGFSTSGILKKFKFRNRHKQNKFDDYVSLAKKPDNKEVNKEAIKDIKQIITVEKQ